MSLNSTTEKQRLRALPASTSLPRADIEPQLLPQPEPSNTNRFERNDASPTAETHRLDGHPLTTAISMLAGASHAPNANTPIDLLRQMRARLAFKRTSTRLYEAFLEKLDGSTDPALRRHGSLNRNTLVRFRNEEAAHFQVLCESLECMGVDPLVEPDEAPVEPTPTLSARELKAAHIDTAEALTVLLEAEQADEAGWQHLVASAHASGLIDLAYRFEQAHSEEIGHVRQLRAWRAMLPAAQRRVA